MIIIYTNDYKSHSNYEQYKNYKQQMLKVKQVKLSQKYNKCAIQVCMRRNLIVMLGAYKVYDAFLILKTRNKLWFYIFVK